MGVARCQATATLIAHSAFVKDAVPWDAWNVRLINSRIMYQSWHLDNLIYEQSV